MSLSRRKFVQIGAALAAAGTAIPNPLLASLKRRQKEAPQIDDPAAKEIANAALDVARALGASYADARLDHTFECSSNGSAPEKEVMSFGVRVLVEGYWGFASSPIWSKEEAARLAGAAIRNARANTVGKARHTELAPLSGGEHQLTGHWSTPIIDDPFTMSMDEIEDFFTGIDIYVRNLSGVRLNARGTFFKQDKLFVSTLGHNVTQRLYQTTGDFVVTVEHKGMLARTSLDTMSIAGAGFEYIRGQPLRDQIRELVDEMRADMSLPVVPVDVGRYETVLDANTITSVLSETIGLATELDRALGYEANAGGTSYIVDPLEMIGTLKIGSPDITVTANRNEPLGAATVKWDDEGVNPKDFIVVKDGILNDMQTDRESASVLKDVYSRQQKTTQSYGCAYAPNSGFVPLTHTANLQIKPGAGEETFNSLVEKVEKGLAFKRGYADMDYQKISGLMSGQAFEVKNGKRVSRAAGAALIFRTPELWSSVTSIGGQSSTKRIGLQTYKGQPARGAAHSVTGVPVVLKEATVIDILRKA